VIFILANEGNAQITVEVFVKKCFYKNLKDLHGARAKPKYRITILYFGERRQRSNQRVCMASERKQR